MSLLIAELSTRARFGKRWLRDGRSLWIWIIVAAASLALTRTLALQFSSTTQPFLDSLRWSGWVFQIVGLVTVVVGLNESRRLFERKSLWRGVLEWLGRARYMIKPPAPQVVQPVSIVSAVEVSKPSVHQTALATTLEERVANLELEQQRLALELSKAHRSISHLRDQTVTRIEREAGERQAADKTLSKKLEQAVIGGIELEVAGIAYLFLGITLATLPAETACLLQAVFGWPETF